MNVTEVKYMLIDTDEKLDAHINLITASRLLAVDTETTGLNPYLSKLRLLQIAVPEKPVLVIDLWKLSEGGLGRLKKSFGESTVKVFQNAKFDIQFLLAEGFEVSGTIFDTMLAAQIINNGKGLESYGLEHLVQYYLGQRLPKEEQKSDWTGELRDKQLEYAAKDAAVLLPLREEMIKHIKEGKLIEVCKLEFECLWAVVDMELSGIGIDKVKWQSLYEKYMSEHKEIKKKLDNELSNGAMQTNIFGEELCDYINLDSQTQVLKALNQKGIEIKNTSHDELIAYKDRCEVISLLLEYRRVSKAIQGFLAPFQDFINPVTGRIHSYYRQLGAHSGRFSCGNPNVQQVPRGKEFRECFVPAEGNKFIIADYSQIELRVAAEIAQDGTMIEAYRTGKDLHALTAALISNKRIEEVSKKERQAAKAVNFGLIYAMGAKGLQGYAKSVYGIDMSLEEAELFRDRFFKAYKGIAAWHAYSKRNTNVQEVRTLSGRRCLYDKEPSITGILNTPVQGTAADITKRALVMLVPVVKELKGRIIATVHDEILLEVPLEKTHVAAKELKTTMERAGAYYLKKVPVVADTVIADSWAEK